MKDLIKILIINRPFSGFPEIMTLGPDGTCFRIQSAKLSEDNKSMNIFIILFLKND